MLLELGERLAERAADAAADRFGVRPENVVVAIPPRYDLGDLALSFAFEVAKRAGGLKPRDVAEAVRPTLEQVDGVLRVEVAGAGFLNVFLDRARLVRSLFAAEQSGVRLGRPLWDGKIVIEHTNINPNKAAHIGHLRNAVLGDTLARSLRAIGQEVEVQNYIDDTGVQVADVVVGLLDIESLDAAAVRALPEPFDHLCWDLYARVGRWYEELDERRSRRQEVLGQIEAGDGPVAELADVVARRIVEAHLRTTARLGIRYDLLAWEGDIIRGGLWSRTFAKLKQTDAVYLADAGKNAGCWMMRLEGTKGFEGMEEPDKVLVRSNGTATYVAKDIAYQMWKFGLSTIDFEYRRHRSGDDALWTTTSSGGADSDRTFGRAARVYNVIDVRQSYLQDVVAASLEALGYREQAASSIHYAYEMVALTPRCAKELGFELDERDRKRPFVEMSGRRGLGVKADDLLDRLTELATAEVASRHEDLTAEHAHGLGAAIAVGAVRYFMLRYGRNKIVAFDLEEALKFQGETGPYLQNSLVRCRSIFRKLQDQEGLNADAIAALDHATDLGDLTEVEANDDAWDLIHHLARLDEALEVAVSTLELSVLARWTFQTAQRFHKYYERYRIKGEPDAARQRERATIIWTYAKRLERALDLMGIPVPDRM